MIFFLEEQYATTNNQPWIHRIVNRKYVINRKKKKKKEDHRLRRLNGLDRLKEGPIDKVI